MVYRKLENGHHAVGFIMGREFVAYASAFDAREAKALVKAIGAVMQLFHATSGAWVTVGPDGKVIPRGASAKAKAGRKPPRARRRVRGERRR